MLAGEQSRPRLLEPALRRRAERDRVDPRLCRQQGVDVGVGRQARLGGVPAADRGQGQAGGGGDGGEMLVAGDLAETDQGELQRHSMVSARKAAS